MWKETAEIPFIPIVGHFTDDDIGQAADQPFELSNGELIGVIQRKQTPPTSDLGSEIADGAVRRNGYIAGLTDKGFGFIRPVPHGAHVKFIDLKGFDQTKDVFFHSNELTDFRFDDSRVGDHINFWQAVGPKGPVALKVGRDHANLGGEDEDLDEDGGGDDVGDEAEGLAESPLVRIVRCFMDELIKRVAEDPSDLFDIEWRDLERLLGVAFAGLGFETTVTRPGKDGGFDLELTRLEAGTAETYLVEVKHWKDQKPGSAHLRKLIDVTASRKATGALLLSTSGFAGTIYRGIVEMTAPVRLGDKGKIISICRAYYRLGSPLWIAASDDPEFDLFEGTAALGEKL